jgi:hypothetical protein
MMLNKLATARLMAVHAYHTGKWLEDNPFVNPQLHHAWRAAWIAENHKHVELIMLRERNEDDE